LREAACGRAETAATWRIPRVSRIIIYSRFVYHAAISQQLAVAFSRPSPYFDLNDLPEKSTTYQHIPTQHSLTKLWFWAQAQIEQEARNAILTVQAALNQRELILSKKADLLAMVAYIGNGDPSAIEDISEDAWQSNDGDL